MRTFFKILFVIFPFFVLGQAGFTESMGTVGGTTTIAAHETANGFDNDGFTMSGSADLRNTTVSSGYTGASGGANVFITTTAGTSFQIAGISTSGCTNYTLSFGALKSTTADDMTNLRLEYSSDGGSNYNNIAYGAQPTGSGTAIWRLISVALPAGATDQASIILRWRQNGTAAQYRIDDISLVPNCNSLNINSVSSSTFNTTCSTGAAGSLTYTTTGTFASGNIITAQLSSSTGSFTSPVTIGTVSGANAEGTNPAGTLNFTIPTGTTAGTGYRIRLISSNPSLTGTDNGSNITVTFTNDCSLSTTAVSSSPFTINCTTAATGTVDYSFTGILNSGNIFTAQLSDATGAFGTPTSIGTLTSTATTGTINISIPSTVSAGTAYRIRVIASSPSTTGTDNGSNLTIIKNACPADTLPLSQGLLINEFSNGTTGEREYYEFVVAGRCGDIVDIRGYIIDDNNGTFSSSFPLTGTGIASGHLRLKNHAQWAAIPVGSLIVVYNAADFSASVIPANDPFDGDGDSLYVIPHNNTTLLEIADNVPSNADSDSTYSGAIYTGSSWGALSLANSGDAVQVRAPDGSYFHGVSYGGAEITGGPDDMKIFNGSMTGMAGWFTDGNFLDASNWSTGVASSNQTPGVANNAANLAWLREMRDPNSTTCPITVLPSEIISFTGKYINNQTELKWQTASEMNNDYFTLYHSVTGYDFKKIGEVDGSGNSQSLQEYRYMHSNPSSGINYYKLKSTDFDGKTYEKGIIAVEAEFNFSYYNTVTQTIELYYEAEIEIYSTDGKLILTSSKTNSIPFTNPGIFFIVNKESGATERLFVPATK